MRRDYIKRVFTNLDKLKLDGIFLSGIKWESEYKLWFTNNKLEIHCFYKDGQLEGEYKRWHNNGKLWIHCFYKDGKVIKVIK